MVTRRRVPLVVVVVVVVGALVGGAAGARLMLGSRTSAPGDRTGRVVLEPIGMVQQDDFVGNLDVLGDALSDGVSVALDGLPDLESTSSTSLSGRVAAGSEPGLYGGSRDTQTCDTARLVEFLSDATNTAKAQAWANVAGSAPTRSAPSSTD